MFLLLVGTTVILTEQVCSTGLEVGTYILCVLKMCTCFKPGYSTFPIDIQAVWPLDMMTMCIMLVHTNSSVVKKFAGNIIIAQEMPIWGTFCIPVKLPTEVVPVYLLAVTYFQTTGLV